MAISRRNRSAPPPSAAASSGCNSLMATGRPCFRSSARNTVAMPNARRTQADMVDLTHRLERLERLHPSLGLETQLEELRELAADVGDNAIQSALQTTVILAIVLVVLAIGLWYNRRRLAAPFGHIVRALERVAAGQDEERLAEPQPEELGLTA